MGKNRREKREEEREGFAAKRRPQESCTSCVLAASAQARGHCSCLSSVGQSICRLVAFLRAAAGKSRVVLTYPSTGYVSIWN